MKHINISKIHFIFVSLLLFCCLLLQQPAHATLFGQGVFGANNPFGSLTDLSMSFSGNVNVNLSPSGGNFEGSGSHIVTVTTNDAVGYRLYVYSPTSSNMTLIGGSDTIAASGNSSPSSLAVNTWGFNTSGSTTNFQGMLTSPTEIKVASGPYTSGDNTTVTYGTKTDITKPAGSYVVSVVYTAVPRFED
jgi:hypothetical protein